MMALTRSAPLAARLDREIGELLDEVVDVLRGQLRVRRRAAVAVGAVTGRTDLLCELRAALRIGAPRIVARCRRLREGAADKHEGRGNNGGKRSGSVHGTNPENGGLREAPGTNHGLYKRPRG